MLNCCVLHVISVFHYLIMINKAGRHATSLG
jgi:hypothetical protein